MSDAPTAVPTAVPDKAPEITDFLTVPEIILIGVNWMLFQEHAASHPEHDHTIDELTSDIAEKVISPEIDRITKKLGHAYAPADLAIVVVGWMSEHWDEFLALKSTEEADPTLVAAAKQFAAQAARLKSKAHASAAYLN